MGHFFCWCIIRHWWRVLTDDGVWQSMERKITLEATKQIRVKIYAKSINIGTILNQHRQLLLVPHLWWNLYSYQTCDTLRDCRKSIIPSFLSNSYVVKSNSYEHQNQQFMVFRQSLNKSVSGWYLVFWQISKVLNSLKFLPD